MILRTSDIPGGRHAGDKNIESNHQKSDIMLKHTSGDLHHYLYHIAEIETQACCFQWPHVNHTDFSATLQRKSLGCKDANITLSKRALMQVRLRSNHFSASQTCTSTLN